MNPAARIAHVKPSLIRVISEGANPDAIPLGLGEPTWELPEAARAALAREAGVCGYGPNAGLPALRGAIAHWHGASADEVLVTSGSQEALFSLFMAWLGPGDVVLVPDPGFTAYPTLARIAGAASVPYALDAADRYRLDATAFTQALDAHPRSEHLVPLFVAAGAAGHSSSHSNGISWNQEG